MTREEAETLLSDHGFPRWLTDCRERAIAAIMDAIAAERAARDAKWREYVDWIIEEVGLRPLWFDKRRLPPDREPEPTR